MSPPAVRSVGILCYEGAQAAAVHGLTDMLTTADRLADERGGRVRVRVERFSTAEPSAPARPLTALVLPPSLEPPAAPAPVVAWIRDRHREGTLLCSVCVGSFLLAETGLLHRRPATTHWALEEAFAARFPGVALDVDRLLVDDGDIITAGGLMAWVDLGLRLVDRLLGPAVVQATARYFLVDPGAREQRFYRTFAPSLTHGDAAVLKVQRWLQASGHQGVTVAAMATRARLSERTFLRRFQQATGLRPIEYLQHLRIGKARDLLELGTLNVDEVARKVGYEDPGAFRRIFRRLMGLSPRDYRRRFQGG